MTISNRDGKKISHIAVLEKWTPDIISYAVWLYYRLNLGHRDIERGKSEIIFDA